MQEMVTPLLKWFQENKRDLEWRKEKTPYTILVSEVMLQQTRVEAVRRYYTRFIKELPSFDALANCPEERLFKLWEGLGYYNRARNLKKCAIIIMNQYQGIFPKSYEEAIQLPGIGDYTCGAILSQAYNKKYAAIDGNVLRVLSRYVCSSLDIFKDKTKKHFKQEIEKILPNTAGTFNEALMELGATVCMPKIALCEECPLKFSCKAKASNTQMEYPKKQPLKEKQNCEYTALFLTDGNKYILISKPSGVLKGLPSPILIDSFLTVGDAIDYISNLGFHPLREQILQKRTHVFTHQKWEIKGYKIFVQTLLHYPSYTPDEIKNRLGIPTCFKQFIREVLE